MAEARQEVHDFYFVKLVWQELQTNEVHKYGIDVPLGHLVCPDCGGFGSVDNGTTDETCGRCTGSGLLEHPEWYEVKDQYGV